MFYIILRCFGKRGVTQALNFYNMPNLFDQSLT